MSPAPPEATPVYAAPSWRRGVAWLIDSALGMAAGGLAAWATLGERFAALPPSPWNPIDHAVDVVNDHPGLVGLAAGVVVAGYVLVPLASATLFGQTPGRALTRLRVVDRSASPPGRGRLAAWSLLALVDTLALFAGNLWALADPERRTLHDRLAGVWVVTARRSNLADRGHPGV